ncbi:hypothetical protein LF65_04813 [Clostridium beijerinckii]|uniref:Flagellar protein FliT n=1 Tax=Clostridium beijerinckii TaxID=1520 RepID=A0A0B5QSW8_CLOBE|nr:flagellar protein FliT [Clostridium beijerinckii]AJH01342.1 hypothetical protein LF65_04813 [Clostridium beijerinckii]
MELDKNFIKYKDITLAIMEAVKKEEYEKLDDFFKQRQVLLDDISRLNCSSEELRKFYGRHEINELDKKLEKEMKNKKDDLLIKIKENQRRKAAMNGYSRLQSKAVFLSKEF